MIIKISIIELNRLIDNNLSNAIKYSKIASVIKIILKDNTLEFHSLGKQIIEENKIFDKYIRENESVGGHGLRTFNS
ncbi:MAG: ATP-binding protein [Saprospiraceae bacterium]|nr:ATP-binding protein [Saprospiraceae bacterium]